eukprot:8308920-Heterocapsa_arctica.AAC.1
MKKDNGNELLGKKSNEDFGKKDYDENKEYGIESHISTLKWKMGKEADDVNIKNNIGTELKKDEPGSTRTAQNEEKEHGKKKYGGGEGNCLPVWRPD